MSDLISRQDVLDVLRTLAFDYMFQCGEYYGEDERQLTIINARKAIDIIEAMPSADPECQEFEWCHDCKEYDQEKHCCHRWTKVIRQTIEELKAQKPETTAKVKEAWGLAMCESCKKRVYENDIYCSHCGAKLEWE